MLMQELLDVKSNIKEDFFRLTLKFLVNVVNRIGMHNFLKTYVVISENTRVDLGNMFEMWVNIFGMVLKEFKKLDSAEGGAGISKQIWTSSGGNRPAKTDPTLKLFEQFLVNFLQKVQWIIPSNGNGQESSLHPSGLAIADDAESSDS
jgi:hypothetical protein